MHWLSLFVTSVSFRPLYSSYCLRFSISSSFYKSPLVAETVYNFLRGEEFLEFFPEPPPLILKGVIVEALDGADRFYRGVYSGVEFAESVLGDLEIVSSASAGSISSLLPFSSS